MITLQTLSDTLTTSDCSSDFAYRTTKAMFVANVILVMMAGIVSEQEDGSGEGEFAKATGP